MIVCTELLFTLTLCITCTTVRCPLKVQEHSLRGPRKLLEMNKKTTVNKSTGLIGLIHWRQYVICIIFDCGVSKQCTKLMTLIESVQRRYDSPSKRSKYKKQLCERGASWWKCAVHYPTQKEP